MEKKEIQCINIEFPQSVDRVTAARHANTAINQTSV